MKCEQNIKFSFNLLESLGFIVYPEKSLFVPTRCIEYPGFVLNSRSMTNSLSDVKKEKNQIVVLRNIVNAFNFISGGNCEFVLKTDACLRGWGVISNSMSAKGVLTFDECNE